jgi:glycosyltransferase involved in cell wall biosynthesis
VKIALASSGFLPCVDGVTVTVLKRVEQLSAMGHEVLLFCPDYAPVEAIYPNWRDFTGQLFPNVRVVNLPSTGLMGVDFERNVARGTHRRMVAELRAFHPDVFHVDEPERMFAGFLRRPGVGFARRAGIPCLATHHTNFIDYAEDFIPLPAAALGVLKGAFVPFLRWVYNAYDETLAVSEPTGARLRAMGFRQVRWVDALGYDPRPFGRAKRTPSFFATRYGLPDVDGHAVIVFLGRLTSDKGWAFTLEAMARLPSSVLRNDVAIVIAGDGDLRTRIAERLGALSPRVHLLGRVPPDDVPVLLRNADIYVTTSLKENRGLTVIEALAAGTPVLAPDCTWARVDVLEDVTGLRFEPGNAADFAARLLRLVGDRALRQRLGEHGKQRASRHTVEAATRRWLEVVEEHVARSKSV